MPPSARPGRSLPRALFTPTVPAGTSARQGAAEPAVGLHVAACRAPSRYCLSKENARVFPATSEPRSGSGPRLIAESMVNVLCGRTLAKASKAPPASLAWGFPPRPYRGPLPCNSSSVRWAERARRAACLPTRRRAPSLSLRTFAEVRMDITQPQEPCRPPTEGGRLISFQSVSCGALVHGSPLARVPVYAPAPPGEDDD